MIAFLYFCFQCWLGELKEFHAAYSINFEVLNGQEKNKLHML